MISTPRTDHRNDFELFGESVVYPGHPIMVALCVIYAYDSLEGALTPTPYGFPAALGSNAIPGAGGCVYSGLHLLTLIRDGLPLEEALAWADETWASCDSQKEGSYTGDPAYYKARWAEGQEQADRFKERLAEKLATWALKGSTEVEAG